MAAIVIKTQSGKQRSEIASQQHHQKPEFLPGDFSAVRRPKPRRRFVGVNPQTGEREERAVDHKPAGERQIPARNKEGQRVALEGKAEVQITGGCLEGGPEETEGPDSETEFVRGDSEGRNLIKITRKQHSDRGEQEIKRYGDRDAGQVGGHKDENLRKTKRGQREAGSGAHGGAH